MLRLMILILAAVSVFGQQQITTVVRVSNSVELAASFIQQTQLTFRQLEQPYKAACSQLSAQVDTGGATEEAFLTCSKVLRDLKAKCELLDQLLVFQSEQLELLKPDFLPGQYDSFKAAAATVTPVLNRIKSLNTTYGAVVAKAQQIRSRQKSKAK